MAGIQKWIYMCNQQVLEPPRYAELYAAEADWVCSLDEKIDSASCDQVRNWNDFHHRLEEFVAAEAADPPPSAIFLRDTADTDAFRVLVEEFAIDGLTEAKSFFHVLPRLPLEAQMPLLRIMIDEFGGGNVRRAHTTLYRQLLQELEMSTQVADYYDRVSESSYAFVNIFYWMSLRCPRPEVFIGGLTYLESSIPSFFSYYVQACARLGIQNARYYSEHVHIDHYHARDGRRTLMALEKYGECNFSAAWKGVLIASRLIGEAFDLAVERAQRGDKATLVVN